MKIYYTVSIIVIIEEKTMSKRQQNNIEYINGKVVYQSMHVNLAIRHAY
jgi:hypothetical protein